MSSSDLVVTDGEIVDGDGVPRANLARVGPATLYGTNDPAEIVAMATRQADVLKDLVDQKKLYVSMGRDRDGNDRRHVVVEGWQTLGTLLGVFPVVVWSRPTSDFVAYREDVQWGEDPKTGKRRKTVTVLVEGTGGWEARCEVRTMNGDLVGAAEAECRYDESTWRARESHSLRSMAQTRAQAKALRGSLAFVVAMAGYQVSPAEEMPDERPPLDVYNLPDGYDPMAWTKQVAMKLANDNQTLAIDAWSQAMDKEGIPEDSTSMDAEAAALVVARVHTSIRQIQAGGEAPF